MAEADGITHIVCTPHANSRFRFDPETNAVLLTELRRALDAEGIRISLGLGCDFHISYDNVQDALAHPSRYTVNGRDYLLVELPDYSISPNIQETFYELRLNGLIPVLTHPERNPTLQRDPNRMLPWLRDGLLCQVTTSSVVGQMGRSAEKLARRMLTNRWAHFLATDAHNTTSRPPRMREAHDLVAKRYSAAYADMLCLQNPLSVFEGQTLGEQQMLGLEPEDQVKLPSWWQRLLRM
jgi:protein-tyrosine phosphatase